MCIRDSGRIVFEIFKWIEPVVVGLKRKMLVRGIVDVYKREGFGRAPMGWMLIAFALSGLGSTLRLGWEERMSVQGVERTAVCAGTARCV